MPEAVSGLCQDKYQKLCHTCTDICNQNICQRIVRDVPDNLSEVCKNICQKILHIVYERNCQKRC